MGFLGKLFGGGSSATTDRSTTLQGYGDLQNLFNFGLDQSKGFSSTGQQDVTTGKGILQGPLNYWKSLLSGDRTQMAAATAPESNAALARADAAKRQSATLGTARGGGSADTSRTIDDQTRAQLDNYLFGVRPAAAGEVGKIGGEFADIGMKELNAALGFGSLGERAASTLTNAAIGSRKDSYEINKDTTKRVTGTIQAILGAIF